MTSQTSSITCWVSPSAPNNRGETWSEKGALELAAADHSHEIALDQDFVTAY